MKLLVFRRDLSGCWRCDLSAGSGKERTGSAQWFADLEDDDHRLLFCGESSWERPASGSTADPVPDWPSWLFLATLSPFIL